MAGGCSVLEDYRGPGVRAAFAYDNGSAVPIIPAQKCANGRCTPGRSAPGSLPGPLLHADDRDEAHAATRRAAEVMREPELRILDLSRTGFAAQLEPHLVHHAEPAGADRMPE